MADAGEILAGRVGREVLGAAQVIFIVFLCGSHVLTGLIAFDTSTSFLPQTCVSSLWSIYELTFSRLVTDGASCSVLWGAVTAIVCLILTLPRTLDGLAYLSVASFISIMSKL